MAKTCKATLSSPSRGSISRGVATISIGEVSEPPPPAVLDNHEFYETWHCCWVTNNFSSSTRISTVTIANFKLGFEYMIAVTQDDSSDELGWHHFFLPENYDDLGRPTQYAGNVDGDVSLNSSTGKVTTHDGNLSLVKIYCRPLRIILSEGERKYPTDWLRNTISQSRTSSFNFELDKEYIGFTTNSDSSTGSCVYRCVTPKIVRNNSNDLEQFIGVTSFKDEKWVEFSQSDYTKSPAISGKLTSNTSSRSNLKYLYEKPLIYTTGAITSGDNSTWKRIYFSSSDTKSLSATSSDVDEFLVVQGDFDGDNELGCGVIFSDSSMDSHVRYDKGTGISGITGPDSWFKLVVPQGKLYSKAGGGMYAVYRRRTLMSPEACPTSATLPDLTIPSEGG